MTEMTSRLQLPLLASGQAQKEVTHNEALALVDMLLHAAVESRTTQAPPSSPQPGQSWLIPASATGAWQGRTGQIACWTGGGWRFAAPRPGMILWSVADSAMLVYVNGQWTQGQWPVQSLTIGGQQLLGPRLAAIADPVGGTTIDSQARTAVLALLATLRTHGLIAN